MKKNSFLFHKILYYGIDEVNLTFENQSISKILQLAILFFLKIFFSFLINLSVSLKSQGSKEGK